MEHMRVLQRHLNFNNSFDVAVWAVATAAFWGCCRLGELTVEHGHQADEKHHVLRSTAGVSYGKSTRSDKSVASMVTFTIPWTKMTKEKGAVLTLVGSEDCSPADAMRLHLRINKDAPRDSHLFSYRDEEGLWSSMFKSDFMERCNKIWQENDMLKVDGHSFRIGGSTELLLGGVPPHVVAMTGR